MKAKDLLSQLSAMEQSLSEFSFEELNAKEAAQLKKTFETFKKRLESRIFHPTALPEDSDNLAEEMPVEQKKGTKPLDPTMLIARVSHEIRTPLNGIIGFTDLLKEDSELNSGQLEQVNAIQKASFSLMEIINELLEYSKLSSGLEAVEMVHFNFRNLIGDVAYLCETLVSVKNVNINVAIDEAIPMTLLGDPSKLSQVLLNLMGNAIKFVEKGKIDLSITAGRPQDDRTILTFTIADTGIGISKENLERIFDSFRQAEVNTHLKYGGSGLGLSIVKQIIELLGGHIQVSSELGVGTTFEFSMPFKLGDDTQITGPKEVDAQANDQKDLVKGMPILIFEDNPLNQRLIEQRLNAWGCKPFITDNAQYGLHILANHKIDLVFMDLKMPGMNGFEITELIRSFEKPDARPIPIVALSADFSRLDKEACLKSGMDGFILKPYTPNELLETLLTYKNDGNVTFSIPSRSIAPEVTEHENGKLDLSGLWDDCMGQKELMQELVRLYKSNVLEFIGKVRMHLHEEDSELIAFAAHKIKPGLKMLKSKGLLDIVEQIQKSCAADADVKHLKFLYESFINAYPKVEHAIDEALNELIKSEG